MNKQLILRIVLSPLVFLWGVFMLCAGTLFPLPLLVMFSFIGFITWPLIWLLRKSGAEIEGIEPFIDDTRHPMIGSFLGMTIYIWGAFAVVVHYIKTGHVFTGGA